MDDETYAELLSDISQNIDHIVGETISMRKDLSSK